MSRLADLNGLIVLTILAGFAACIFIFLLTPLAERFHLLDKPNHRKHHEASVPMVGGLAIYLVIISAMVVLDLPHKLSWLIFSVGILVAVGAIDDALNISVWVRFVSQFIAAGLMIAGSSLWIQSFGVNAWALDSINAWAGIPITIFAVIGLTNGFNMVDGIDGLAAGHMLVGLVAVSLTLFIRHGYIHQAEWIGILIAVVFAFWLVNLSLTPLKRVFLGDAGSLLLGFIMAWTLIYYTQEPIALLNPVVALWCVAIPVFDTLVVIARRVKNRQSPFSPDRNHIHHLLVDIGVNSRITLFLILGLSAFLNLIGIWITYAVSPLASLIAYALMLIGFAYGMLNPSIQRQLLLKLKLLNSS